MARRPKSPRSARTGAIGRGASTCELAAAGCGKGPGTPRAAERALETPYWSSHHDEYRARHAFGAMRRSTRHPCAADAFGAMARHTRSSALALVCCARACVLSVARKCAHGNDPCAASGLPAGMCDAQCSFRTERAECTTSPHSPVELASLAPTIDELIATARTDWQLWVSTGCLTRRVGQVKSSWVRPCRARSEVK